MERTRTTTKHRWAWSLVLTASILVAVLVWLPWLGGGWIPKLQAFGLWLLVLPLALGLIALFQRRWAVAAVLFICLLAGSAASINPQVPPASTDAGGATLTVMSFNALKAGADPDALAEAIRQADPDVLVLVETSEPLHAALARRGAIAALKFRSAQAPAGGERDTVIFSRYPLTERSEELASAATGWHSLPVAELQLPQGPITVAGIHIFPPLHDATRWNQGLEALAQWSQQEHGTPVILAGDFNAVRAHPQYRRATTGFTESSGLWPNTSWPALGKVPAVIEIDHILVKDAAAQRFETSAIKGSDHLGVVSELMINP